MFRAEACAFRLAPRGRAVDSEFPLRERLFRRCALSDSDTADPGRLFPDQIKFYPDWSVNRGRYSKPRDVLYPDHVGLSIAVFRVRDIPTALDSGGGVTYHWGVQHRPLENNYAHAEVWTYKSDEHITKTDLPKGIKKRFRTILSERAHVIHTHRGEGAEQETKGKTL